MNPNGNARRLRRQQTVEERQLWLSLRAGRFAGFKFRRQHPVGGYILDFYCPAARLAVELDGFMHGKPAQMRHDAKRAESLAEHDIQELRFWNHQWRKNRDGILLEIWDALHRRTGCVQIMRNVANQRFIPPRLDQVLRIKSQAIASASREKEMECPSAAIRENTSSPQPSPPEEEREKETTPVV